MYGSTLNTREKSIFCGSGFLCFIHNTAPQWWYLRFSLSFKSSVFVCVNYRLLSFSSPSLSFSFSCPSHCNLIVTSYNDRKQEGKNLVKWELSGKGCRVLCKCQLPWISHSVRQSDSYMDFPATWRKNVTGLR